jgi:AGZA family xanthine/uracil permease-like MFS transporter
VAVIERRFRTAAAWCALGAVLAALGLVHSYRWTPGDTAIALAPAWPWVGGYLLMAAVFAAAPWLTTPDDGAGH